MPGFLVRPQKSRFELDATDPQKARLHYEETFEKLDDELVEKSRALIEFLAKLGGVPAEVPADIKREGNTISYEIVGEAGLLSSGMASEFLFQSFEGNAEKKFWRWVDAVQLFISTQKLPIRKLYQEYTGESLAEPPAALASPVGPQAMLKAECTACHLRIMLPKSFVDGEFGDVHCANAECGHHGRPRWKGLDNKEAEF